MSVFAQQGQRLAVSDPRAEDRTYHFADTNKELPYCVFASSKIADDTPAPLIITLHGRGGTPQRMCNTKSIDLAEAGGYILAAPMGYNPVASYRGPRQRAGGENQPENLSELAEKDVMNVLEMMLDEFNIDENRIYLTGHSMGGSGTLILGSKHADIWAAIAATAPAGGLREIRSELLRRLKVAGVPVLLVHGDGDQAVPVRLSRDWAAAMDDLNIENEYVELPGVGHRQVSEIGQEYIYEFFAQHSK
jgi:predicted peptidase